MRKTKGLTNSFLNISIPLPKSFVYKMLRKKRIKHNGKKAEGSEIIKAGDSLQMYLSDETMGAFMEEKAVAKAERHFGIVYEDDNIIIVSKPAGLLIASQKSGRKRYPYRSSTILLSQKGQYCPFKRIKLYSCRLQPHDRNTGGIVIAGKNLRSVQELNRIIAERKLKKYYVTMVRGEFEEEKELFGYHIKDGVSNSVKVLKKEVLGAKKVYTKVRPLCVWQLFIFGNKSCNQKAIR